MALQRLVISGYGQIELNNVAFRRDGRIEAQCKLDGTDFATAVAENGMLLLVDNVSRTVKLPADADAQLVALNYSSEHIYDERTPGLKNFKLGKTEFPPRLGYLATGDKFTTNCIAYDDTEFADEAALLVALGALTTPLYGTYCSNGAIKLTNTAPTTESVTLQAVKKTTMPDGTLGVKFQVIKA